MLAIIANEVIPSKCLEFGTNCPQALTGDPRIDFPSMCAVIEKTACNISPLDKLDAFDWTVPIVYFGILFVLAIYGVYRVKQVAEFWRYSKFPPKPNGHFAEADLPFVTIQLPL